MIATSVNPVHIVDGKKVGGLDGGGAAATHRWQSHVWVPQWSDIWNARSGPLKIPCRDRGRGYGEKPWAGEEGNRRWVDDDFFSPPWSTWACHAVACGPPQAVAVDVATPRASSLRFAPVWRRWCEIRTDGRQRRPSLQQPANSRDHLEVFRFGSSTSASLL